MTLTINIASYTMFRPHSRITAGSRWLAILLAGIGLVCRSPAADPLPAPDFEFNRYATHWGMLDEDFIAYAEQVRPQAIQVGFWGPAYYSAMGYALDGDKPALFSGIGGGKVDTDHRRRMIRRAQAAGIKVIGHFSLTMFYGDLEQNLGFFKYIDNGWDEDRLGPKIRGADGEPIRAVDMLQAGPDGVRKQNWYNVEGGSEYWADPANPYYREILKRFVRAGIEDGLDGFTIVFPHLEYGNSDYLVEGFRAHLTANHTPAELLARFAVEDPDRHPFDVITGWYEPDDSRALRHEMLKYVQQVLWETKQAVFMDYGRRLKPDLLVGQWNHIYRSSMSGPGQLAGTFAQLNADEQGTLPAAQWSAGENWVWYSIGNWRMYWQPADNAFSQFSLVHRYLRAAGGGLPQAVKTDDNRNVAMVLAEAVAHGGFAYARGPAYRQAATVEIVGQYFDFLRQHERLYREMESYAQVALVFPRTRIHQGDTAAIPAFKALGDHLLRAHVLFDVVVDEQFDDDARSAYAVVLTPDAAGIGDREHAALARARAWSVGDLPPDVVAVAWHQPAHRRVILHLVNHTYHVTPADLGRPAEFVHPTRFAVTLPMPGETRVTGIELYRPDGESRRLDFESVKTGVSFEMGPMGTYAVAAVAYEPVHAPRPNDED